MADITGPPQVGFAGGFYSGRVDSTMREEVQVTWFNCTSIDTATTTSANSSQATGYQIHAGNTLFTTVAANSVAVLPATNRPFPLTGMTVLVTNTGANPLTVFPSTVDSGGTINGQASVVLGANSITPFQCQTVGLWYCDGIGEGFAGSLATVISQGNLQAAGTTQTAAAVITQAMVNVGGSSGGVALPAAAAGLQIVVNSTNATGTINVYPVIGGTDHINALANNAGFPITNPVAAPTIFYCFNTGAWVTK